MPALTLALVSSPPPLTVSLVSSLRSPLAELAPPAHQMIAWVEAFLKELNLRLDKDQDVS